MKIKIYCDEALISANGSSTIVEMTGVDESEVLSDLRTQMSDYDIAGKLDISDIISKFGEEELLSKMDIKTVINFVGFDTFAEYFETEFKIKKLGL